MTLNPSIRKVTPAVQPQAVASYDFFDLASGKGIKTFYCGDVNSVSGANTIEYKMGTSPWYSDQGYFVRTRAEGAWIDLTFDMILNMPLVIEGETIINVPIIQKNDSGGTNNITSHTIAALYKVDGDQAIFLGSGASVFKKNGVGNNEGIFHLHAISFDIPKTRIIPNQKMRVNVQSSGKYVQVVGFDPHGRTNDEIFDGTGAASTDWGTTTALTAQIPIVIDIS